MTQPHNADTSGADTSGADTSNPDATQPAGEEDEDYYFDGPYLVFTEAYHLKRGFCCQSGCRHCPYGFAKDTAGTPV